MLLIQLECESSRFFSPDVEEVKCYNLKEQEDDHSVETQVYYKFFVCFLFYLSSLEVYYDQKYNQIKVLVIF